MNDSYIGEVLFHCWRETSTHRAFTIFDSIVHRGLLMTRGNGGLIDRFPYLGKNGKVEHIEVVQNARVCFTDIPIDKLRRHTSQYGNCAAGFSRQTILEWGGCPVWYVPNHVTTGTLQDQASGLLYGVADASRMLKLFQQFVSQNHLHPTEGGKELSTVAGNERIESAVQSLMRLCSYLKEMSAKEVDDHRYLYEREWRLVSGLKRDGCEDPYRRLTAEEKEEMCDLVPQWRLPMESLDPQITDKFSREPLIESFSFFNGIPGGDSVAKRIEIVLVPDEAFVDLVAGYVESNKGLFKPGGPEIITVCA